MGDGFNADPAALQDAGSRIAGVIREMKPSDLAHLGGNLAVCGHEDVSRALGDFCSAVETSAQILVQTSEAASTALRDIVRSYSGRDQETQVAVQQIANQHAPGGR